MTYLPLENTDIMGHKETHYKKYCLKVIQYI